MDRPTAQEVGDWVEFVVLARSGNGFTFSKQVGLDEIVLERSACLSLASSDVVYVRVILGDGTRVFESRRGSGDSIPFIYRYGRWVQQVKDIYDDILSENKTKHEYNFSDLPDEYQ